MRRRDASAARAVGRYLRMRWAPLAFIAVLIAYRATQWGYFVVPAPDFFDFEHTARALAHGRLPDQFQRAPLYPALIALVTPALGGARPTLAAAQGLNLVLSAAALVIVYELCALLVGRWALLVVALTGLHWTMAYVTVHPLVEPTLMTATLAALYLDASGRRGKYLAAGLAAAARYEGVFVIAALALADLWRRRSARVVIAAAAAAAAPTAAWLTIGALRAAPNPYVDVIIAQTPAGWEFVRSTAISAMGFAPVQALEGLLAGGAIWRALLAAGSAAIAGLMAVGAYQLIRRHRDIAVSLLLFGAFYVAIHVIYPAANTRFVLPVLWLIYLLALVGAMTLAQWAQATVRMGHGWRWAGGLALGVGASAAAVWAARRDGLWIVPLAAPLAVAAAGGGRLGAKRLLVTMPAAALMVAGGLGLGGWYLDRESRWWAELEPVARWCQQPPTPAVRLAATRSALELVREICPQPRVRFYDLAQLDAVPGSGSGRRGASLPADVTHVLWCSTDTPLDNRGPQMVLSHRYADERQRLIPTGGKFVRRVARGHEAGWRACARFAVGDQRAVIYGRRNTVQARAGWEAKR